jgi:hypothetical protein
MTYQRSGMWGFVWETIGECRNVTLMDQKVIPDEANKNKQKFYQLWQFSEVLT